MKPTWLRGGFEPADAGDGLDGVCHEINCLDAVSLMGILDQLATQSLVDQRIEHEHAPIAGMLAVKSALQLDEFAYLVKMLSF